MQTTLVKNYSTLEALIEDIKKAIHSKGTHDAFIEMRDYLRYNKTAVISILSQKKLSELTEMVYKRTGDTKGAIIKRIYDSMLSSFIFDEFVSTNFNESYENAINRIFESQTEEQYNNWIVKKKKTIAERKKALENPETIAEFNTFIDYKGEKALTIEQRARFDELRADSSRGNRQGQKEKDAEIKAVDVPESLTFTIKESFHTKKQIKLWVVVISERVDREKFNELKSKADKLDGYYSSYNKDGAIPGFTFERPEAAQLFANLKNGDVNATTIQETIAAERKENQIESLREKADRMLAEATESLQKERKDNTFRRARMAANAENDAIRRIEFAKTMTKIAEAIENGTIKYLDKLANITDLETLLNILVSAKWKHINDEKLNYNNYEITEATANFATFPYPILYKGNERSVYNMKNTKGKKMAAARMLKRLEACDEFIVMDIESKISDYEILFCTICKEMSSYNVASYKEELMRLKRIRRMHIEKIFELRAALRELINIKAGIDLTPEEKRIQKIRELERSFLYLKIPGFFPTPPELAVKLVELANIEESHTICEPNAGLGHLAEAISEAHPENFLQCIEIYSRLVEALNIKGFETLNEDFLQHDKKYDRIIMNPPFENLQDIDHVMHAYSLLNPGGRVVAIMANNKRRDTSKVKMFMELVDRCGSIEENPVNSFASAFRPTGVNTITVVLDKPF